ncbi:MAG: hypothetical protein HWE27_19355 [Gammaproteobacteria bacterium]|nr:hypothetical protein [Gammaproteobacteria bacterium]
MKIKLLSIALAAAAVGVQAKTIDADVGATQNSQATLIPIEPCPMKKQGAGSDTQNKIMPIDDCDGGGGGGGGSTGPTRAPSTPPSIKYAAFTQGDNQIDWSSSNGYGYSVKYKLEEQRNNGSWNIIYDGYGKQKSLANKSGGTYRYRVKGCNSKGCSSYRYGYKMSIKPKVTKDYESIYPGLVASRTSDSSFINNNKRFYDVNKEASSRTSGGSNLRTTSFLHNLGKGFGLTEGQYAPEEVCLKPDDLYVNSSNVNSSDLRIHQLETREDLYEKLDLDISASLSMSIGKFGTQADAKYQLFREAQMHQEYSTLLMKWERKAERLDLQSSTPRKLKNYYVNNYLNPYDGTTVPEVDFRNNCGDRYLSAVVTGARIYVLLEIKNENYSSTEMENISWDVKAKFAEIINASSTGSISTETRRMFEKFEVSFKAVTEGGSSPTQTVKNLTIDNVKDYFNNFIAGVKPSGYVALDREFSHYPVPVQYNTLNYHDVFADHRPLRNQLTRWIALDNQVNDRCASLTGVSSSYDALCNAAKRNIGWQATHCASGEEWVDCRSPYSAKFTDDSNNTSFINFTSKFYNEIPSLYAPNSETYTETWFDITAPKPGWLGAGKWRGDSKETCLPTKCIVDHAKMFASAGGPSGTRAILGSQIYVNEYKAKDGNASHTLLPKPNGQKCLKSVVNIKSDGWPGRDDARYRGSQSFHGLCPQKMTYILP